MVLIIRFPSDELTRGFLSRFHFKIPPVFPGIISIHILVLDLLQARFLAGTIELAEGAASIRPGAFLFSLGI